MEEVYTTMFIPDQPYIPLATWFTKEYVLEIPIRLVYYNYLNTKKYRCFKYLYWSTPENTNVYIHHSGEHACPCMLAAYACCIHMVDQPMPSDHVRTRI